MPFQVTLEGSMYDALYLNKLKYSDGLRAYSTSGVISWLSDTRFRIVLPANDNIGTKILWTYPNYYGCLLTQTKVWTQSFYEIKYQMKNLGTLVFGYTRESVSNEEIRADSITIAPGNFTATLPASILNFTKPYTAIITTPGEYTFTYIKSGYSTATKKVVVKQWQEGDDVQPVMVNAELTLLSGQYYGYLSGDVKVDINTPNQNVDAKATISGGGFVVKTKTDHNGNYFFHLPIGTYTVKFSKDGYESTSITVSITAGNTVRYGVVLMESKAVIAGNIVYKGSYNVNGTVRLDLLDRKSRQSETQFISASENRFRFASLSKGDYKIIASLDGSPPLYGNTHWFSLDNNERKKTFIELAPHTNNSLTGDEIRMLSTVQPRKDITKLFDGAEAHLTTIGSL